LKIYWYTFETPFKFVVHFTLIPPQWHTYSTGCHSYDDHLSPNQDGGKNKNVVNLGAIRQGMKRFQFLLNCCEPGTIPDASILAAALDLVSLWKNVPTPVSINAMNRGEHASLISTPTAGLCLEFSPLRIKWQKGEERWFGERLKKGGKSLVHMSWEVECVSMIQSTWQGSGVRVPGLKSSW
jgi:hypothetical protein